MQDDRREYLDYLARCNQAFRPFAPIDLVDFFVGRTDDVHLLQTELARPGRHVAIFGERGVGKTSLATLAYYFAGFDDECTAFVRCEQASTYETIFGAALQHAGVSFVLNGAETSRETSGGLTASLASASRSKKSSATYRAIDSARSISPASLLRVFGGRKGLIILDEYDRVRDAPTHTRLAETLKHFSDAASETKLVVVGVADTLSELVGEHQSLTRCLAQVRLDRMRDDELHEIIKTAERRIGVVFKEEIKERIVGLSDGFPFFTHLLGGYAAEEAGQVLLRNASANPVVSEPEYRKAIRRAIDTAEGTLREQYQSAIITTKRKTDMFRYVLWSIAYSEHLEVQVREISEGIGLLFGERPVPESLNNYLGPLIKKERQYILERVRQGYYRFTNPLMRAYVRLMLEDHNIVEMNGQMRFPWMRSTS